MPNISNKKILVNYADGGFYQSQSKNSQCALLAGFNIVYQMKRENIDPNFYESNKHILDCKRLAGYGLWKYYFQDKILSGLKETDILMYCDCDANFIKPAQPLFDLVMNDPKGVICFLTPDRPDYHVEWKWTKSDVFRVLGVDSLEEEKRNKIKNTQQIQSGFKLMRGTAFAKKFIKDCLQYACMKNLVDDSPSTHQKEVEGFCENRHDQSIWSVMCKLHSVTCVDDFTQWGNNWRRQHGSADDWFFVDLHNNRN
jgi:hypothetical protein